MKTRQINTVMRDSSKAEKNMEKECKSPNFNNTKDIFSKAKDVGKEL